MARRTVVVENGAPMGHVGVSGTPIDLIAVGRAVVGRTVVETTAGVAEMIATVVAVTIVAVDGRIAVGTVVVGRSAVDDPGGKAAVAMIASGARHVPGSQICRRTRTQESSTERYGPSCAR